MNITLKCSCGKVRGIAQRVVAAETNRAVCLCNDCQAFAHYLGRADEILDENGGTDIFPVTPARLKITEGQDQIQCIRLTEEGMYRWFAGCCKTPIANTMAMPKVPFVGVFTMLVDLPKDEKSLTEALGPVRARLFGKHGLGTLPEGTSEKAPFGFMMSAGAKILKAWVKKEYAPHPFFNAVTWKPMVTPEILSGPR